ncbi:MAG: type transport system permease protein [Gaiellaceae bacterium]|nr:type transport system permease protein [Gaiellaceae bacterium]
MRRAWLVLGKDLRILRRSPFLLGVLVAYPIVIALLVGLVAGYANAKPRVAFVDEDGLPAVIAVGGHKFHVQSTIDRVSRNVRLVRLSPKEADRELRTGKVVATITVPPGFVADLKQMVRSPTLVLRTTKGGVAPRVNQQVQALVYSLNRQLQEAYIAANLEYVRLILHGGDGSFLGRDFHVLGLDGTERLLRDLPRGPRLDRIRSFVTVARLALAQTGGALAATAHPIELKQAPEEGRTWALSAQVQAYALALTISFLTLLLAAGALAAERDENTIGRLSRGLVSLGELVAAKIGLAVVVALALGLSIALLFGAIIQVGGIVGGEPWARLPLLAIGLALAGAALGGLGALLGALAREARTASLVAVLVVLPIVFLGLVPGEIVPVAGWISDALPFAHAVRFFASALYDASPWGTLAREAAWLGGLAIVFGAAARAAARRLLV